MISLVGWPKLVKFFFFFTKVQEAVRHQAANQLGIDLQRFDHDQNMKPERLCSYKAANAGWPSTGAAPQPSPAIYGSPCHSATMHSMAVHSTACSDQFGHSCTWVNYCALWKNCGSKTQALESPVTWEEWVCNASCLHHSTVGFKCSTSCSDTGLQATSEVQFDFGQFTL